MKATAIAVMIVFRYKTKIVKNLKFLINVKSVEIAQKYPSDDTYNMYDFRNW